MFRSLNLFILFQLERRVLDRIQSRKNQESEQKEINQSLRTSYQTAITTMESTRMPHLNNHDTLVVGILLHWQLSLLRALLQTTLLVDNLLPLLKLDEGIRLILLQQRTPIVLLLLPRTGLRRKELDVLVLEPDLPNPNPPPPPPPPNQQHLLIHPEKTKAEPFLPPIKKEGAGMI